MKDQSQPRRKAHQVERFRRRSVVVATLALLALHFPVRIFAQDKTTFNDHVQPVFANACASCHNPDKKKGGLDLTTQAGVLAGGGGGAVVEAGNPGGSRLLKILRQEIEPKMPPEGPKTPETQVALVEKWIAGGLLETKDSKAAAKKQGPSLSFTAKAGKPDGPPPMPHLLPIDPIRQPRRSGTVTALACSPWAPLVAVGGEKQVALYNTDTLQPEGVLDFPEGGPFVLRFSADSRFLLAGGGQGGKNGRVVVWEVAGGRRRIEVGKESDTVLAADVRADLTQVALGGPSRKVKFYATGDGTCFQEIKKHTEWITAAAYSPDGVLLATGDRNGGVQVWEADSQAEFQTLRGHEKGITATAWRPDGNLLATASEDGTVRFWDMNNGNQIKNWNAHGGGVLDAAWSPDGLLATGGRDRKAKVWKSDGSLLKEMPEQPEMVTRVALGWDGKRLFTGDYAGAVTVWDVNSGSKLGDLAPNPPPVAQRLAVEQQRLQEMAAKVPAAQQALAAATAAKAPVAQALDECGKALAQAEAARQAAVSKRDQQKSALDQAEAAKAQAVQIAQGAAQTVSTMKAPLDAAAQGLTQAQAALTAAQAAKAAAEKLRDERKPVMEAARAARDAEAQNPEKQAKCAEAEKAFQEAEAAVAPCAAKEVESNNAMQQAVAARDAAQAAFNTALADETKKKEEMNAAAAKADGLRKEFEAAAGAAQAAEQATGPMKAKVEETKKQLDPLVAAEAKAAADRDAAQAALAQASSLLRRWQAAPLLTQAAQARQSVWECEAKENEAKSRLAEAEAALARNVAHRDKARQALIDGAPYAKARLFLAQAGLRARRQQIEEARRDLERIENERVGRQAVVARLEREYVRLAGNP